VVMSIIRVNPTLLRTAEWRLEGVPEKRAFVPQGATDPAAMGAGGMPPMGGMPPGDPMAMGGMPPMDPAMMGGMPPMDPSMMGGMPPMDPAMMGGMPPMDPAMMGGAPPAPAPAANGTGAKSNKVPPELIYMELGRNRKLLTHIMRHFDIPMPPDILDDSMVASAMNGQVPQSQPLGQEPAPPSLPGIGSNGELGPLQAAGGTEKPASDIMSMFRLSRAVSNAYSASDAISAAQHILRSYRGR